VVKAVLAVYWSRLGSLNALEMTRGAKFWKAWLGQPLCSADSLGRIVASVDADTLRKGIHHVYDRLKRNKALPDLHGLAVAVLDGHETSASYRGCCDGCLKRSMANGQIQFYHRNVTLMLLCGSPPGRPAVRLLLDLEPQRPRGWCVPRSLGRSNHSSPKRLPPNPPPGYGCGLSTRREAP